MHDTSHSIWPNGRGWLYAKRALARLEPAGLVTTCLYWGRELGSRHDLHTTRSCAHRTHTSAPHAPSMKRWTIV